MGFRVFGISCLSPRGTQGRPFGRSPLRVVRRSIKILPGIRLNFGKRGISTSIGIRGAHVTIGKTGTRTTVGLPGSSLSFTHLDKQRRERLVVLAPSLDSGASPGNAWRGWLWIALTVVAIAAAAAHVMK
jgi:hypothetical protein